METNVYELIGIERLKKLASNAVDFIVETQENNDYICEENGIWCSTHCIDTLRKECVIHFLETNYKKRK